MSLNERSIPALVKNDRSNKSENVRIAKAEIAFIVFLSKAMGGPDEPLLRLGIFA